MKDIKIWIDALDFDTKGGWKVDKIFSPCKRRG